MKGEEMSSILTKIIKQTGCELANALWKKITGFPSSSKILLLPGP